jgi:aminoglycoside 6'-N-acetyltransferase I
MVAIRMLGPDDAPILDCVAPDVFDNEIDANWTAEFLADPRHHMAVAVLEDQVIGMASGVHYVHPDKGPELWVNEVGVAPPHRKRGIAKGLIGVLFAHARTLGCTEAWLGTEEDNAAARALYRSLDGEEQTMVYVTFELKRLS